MYLYQIEYAEDSAEKLRFQILSAFVRLSDGNCPASVIGDLTGGMTRDLHCQKQTSLTSCLVWGVQNLESSIQTSIFAPTANRVLPQHGRDGTNTGRCCIDHSSAPCSAFQQIKVQVFGR